MKILITTGEKKLFFLIQKHYLQLKQQLNIQIRHKLNFVCVCVFW